MGLLVLQAGVGNLCPELEISEASHPLLGPPVSGPELTNRSHSRKRQTSPNRNILRGQLQRKVFNRGTGGASTFSGCRNGKRSLPSEFLIISLS